MKIENKTMVGISKVQDVTIRYSIKTDNSGTTTEVLATISNVSGEIMGSANARANGIFGVSLNENNALDSDHRRAIIAMILDDVDAVFQTID